LGPGLGCGEFGGDSSELAFQVFGLLFGGAGVFFGLAAGGVDRVDGFPDRRGGLR
jgi:hypothetical protein